MNPPANASPIHLAARYPRQSRRVLGELETSSIKVERVRYAPGLCVARHAHDTPHFIYIVDGLHWSGHSRGGDACAPGTVRFLPAGEPHENYFPVGSHCLHVELFLPILALAREDGALLRVSGELASPSAPALGARLLNEFSQKDDVSALAVEELLMELLLSGVRRSPLRRGRTPSWLLRVREMLYEHGTTHLTLADLSRCAGRHPVQVSRQFHHHFGCTISEYVRRVRIARAQILLSHRDLSVADLALASGFSDQSHFTNAFRRLTGVPPHRYSLQNRTKGFMSQKQL
jgi:AraC family transcriptional regulator